jgi:hypothetical protein
LLREGGQRLSQNGVRALVEERFDLGETYRVTRFSAWPTPIIR